MLKGLGDLSSLMKTAHQMQGRMQEIQDGLARIQVEGVAGGGMVRVEANCQQQIIGIQIEESVIQAGDREMLEDLVIAATNQAIEKSKQTAAEEMSKLSGEVDLPGLQETLSKLGLGRQS